MTNELSLGFASAFTLGLLHSLEPSHSKAVLAAYFLNRKRTLWEAVAFAVTVTIAHTLVIYLLAFLGFAAGFSLHPETGEHWSEVIGGMVMIGVGIWMFWSEWKVGFHRHPQCEHDHSHGHFFHHHDYRHDHPTPASWRQIFLLGFCSGAIPCMSGMVVLVMAWTTASPAYGLALVAMFSLGLGLVVLIMCVAMQQMARLMDAYWQNSRRWNRFLPAFSSIIIVVMGVWVACHRLHAASPPPRLLTPF